MLHRFSLVELMIAVGIVAVLAAIAVPELQKMQLRAKRSEVALVTDGIWMAQMAYEAAHDEGWFGDDTWYPDADPGKTQRPWMGIGSPFDPFYAPEGEIRGSYHVGIDVGCPPVFVGCSVVPDTCWAISGMVDVDDDDVNACVVGWWKVDQGYFAPKPHFRPNTF